MKIRSFNGTFPKILLPGLFLLSFFLHGLAHATVGKPMLVYSEDETASVQYSQFSSSSWATAATAATTTNKQYWKVAKTHPKGNKKVVVSVENPSSGDPYLYATLWDESNWDDGTGASYNDVKQLGQVYTNSYRCFDAAYEETSGKLLVVAASPTANTIKYWTWNGSTWSSENTYTFSTTLGNIHWIRLASNPKPGSNEIALIALDNGSKVSVLTWNGSSWGNEANVSTSANTNTQEAIGIDYIKVGQGSYDGYAIAVWGQSTNIYFAYWNGSSWTYSSGHYKAVTGSPHWVRHKSDPNNNYSVTVYENSSNEIYAIGFQGVTPLNGCETISSGAIGDYRYHRPFDFAYSSGSNINTTYRNGYSYIVYGEPGNLRYMPCQSSTGTFSCGGASNIKNGATSYYAYWVQAERAVDNTIHMAIHDTSDDLVMWTFAANTWTYRGTVSTNLEHETNHVYEVFSLVPERAAKAMAIFSEQYDYTPVRFSPYSSSAWGGRTSAWTPSSNHLFWKTLKSSSDGIKQVAVAMEYTNSTTDIPHLYASIYDGSTWGTSKDFGHVYSDTEDRSGSLYYNSRTRVYDVAYETSDGHILVVATDPSNPAAMNYWTYNGTTWSSPSSLTFTNLWVHTIRWAKLVSNPKPNSNEIALIVAADYNGTYARAVAIIWNGSSWGNEQLLSTDLNPAWSNAVEPITAEYMQAGSEAGKAVVAWADQYNYVYGRVWNGSSWDTAQSKAAATEVRWVRLKADPASSNMMLGFETWGRHLYAVKWTGAGWESSSPTSMGTAYSDTTTNDPIHRPFDLCFESGYGHSGHAIFAYSGYNATSIYYYHYDGSSWGSQATAYSGVSASWVELDRAKDNTIHMALHDWSDDLYTQLWDNSSWVPFHNLTLPSTSLEIGELGGSSSHYPEVFSLTKIPTAIPEIHAVDYNFGAVGASITIHGVGFGATQGTSTVKFYNNQTATATSWSDVKIVATVPASTASGYITLTRGSNSDTISFSAITGAPTITAILPDKGSNFSDIDVAYITGTNLSPGMTLKLKKSGQSDITATSVTVTSSTRIETATFNTTSAATGLWDVEVTGPDTQSATGSNLFAVHSPAAVTTAGAQARASGSGLAYPNERHLARDSGGNWYALFIGDDSCIYMTKSSNGSTWDTPACVFAYSGGLIDTSTYAQEMSADIYRSGNVSTDVLHLVWRSTDAGNYKDILYSKCSNLSSYTSATSWAQVDGGTSPRYDTLTYVNGASYYLYQPDIAVDSQGYPHVTWYYQYSSNKYIVYRTSRTGAGTPKDWDNLTRTVAYNSDETDYGDVYYPSSIEVDSNDRVYVSWPMYVTSTGKYGIRTGWTTDWTNWDTANRATVISTSGNNFYESSIAIDSANKIYVVAKEETGLNLYWAHYNGSSWSTSNNLTNGSFSVESAVVGAKMGGGITDHVLFSKVYDASSNKKVIYWRWDSTNSNWNKYSEELDTGNDSRSYVILEKHSPSFSSTMGYLFYDTSGDKVYFDQIEGLSQVTAVKLASFTVYGEGVRVKVQWVTKTEISNRGFNLYRSTERDGTYIKINPEIVPGLLSSASGKAYVYADYGLTQGNPYYYKLEDIDLSGKRTMHGPVSLEWAPKDVPGAAIPGGADPTAKVVSGGGSLIAGGSHSGSSRTAGAGGDFLIPAFGGSGNPTQVVLRDLKAYRTDGGIYVEWKTGFEVNNLGFHVYRQQGDQLVQLTPQPVAGSAFLAGPGTSNAGHRYSWLDAAAVGGRRSAFSSPPPSPSPLEGEGRGGGASVLNPQSSVLKYWIEDVDLSGKRTWHGPVSPVYSEKPMSKRSQSALLSHLSKEQGARRSQESLSFNPQSAIRPAPRGVQGSPEPDMVQGAIRNPQPNPGPQADLVRDRLANIVVPGLDDGPGSWGGGALPLGLSDKPFGLPAPAQRALAASSAVKIFVQREGWYRISQADLVAAGMSSTVNPKFLQLYVDGIEQAVVVNGERDGRLGAQDSIEFYGAGLDNTFTDTRVYWLVPGAKPGKRISQASRGAGIGRGVSAASFPFTVEDKPRSLHFAALKNGEESNFFGPMILQTALERTLTLSHLDPAAPGEAALEVALQGATLVPHRVKILLNGVEVATTGFQDQSRKVIQIPLAQPALREGANQVSLASLDSDLDISLLDYAKITYWRTYSAEEDTLKFTSSTGKRLLVDSFTSSQIRAVDITNPQKIQEVTGSIRAQGAGYAIQFEAAGSGERTYLAFTEDQILTPSALELNLPSNWYLAGRSADLVIISHGDYVSALSSLKTLRESQGLSVALIDVEDLYDEFSFGIKTPQAIKDFLTRARSHWSGPPRYVLLVGDASYDPRNYLGFGNFDYVPTKLIDTTYLETASDDWFVDFDGDGIPDIPIGRIPVHSPADAQTVVAKILAYEQAQPQKQIVLVSDIDDPAFSFEGASTALRSGLPQDVSVQEVFRSRFGDDDLVHANLFTLLNQGPLLVNFVGHGSIEVWRGGMLDTGDEEEFSNGSLLPFFVNMTCLNGHFQAPNADSLAETLLTAHNGGAIAVWASSGMTEPEGQAAVNRELVSLLFNGESLTIGEAVKRAKAATGDADVRKTWILFGDPTTKLKY